MNCRDLSEFLQDYFAGELPEHVSAEFSSHLGGCDNCTVFLTQYRLTIEAGATVADGECADCPDELIDAVLAAIRSAEDAQ